MPELVSVVDEPPTVVGPGTGLFFNEILPYPAQWLRNLWPGCVVDQTSIVALRPERLRDYKRVHLFAGIGGWQYALELAGWPDDEVVWSGSCPCQPFSVAGNQLGEEDERHLWPDMLRLVAECAPPVIFGEQVAGQLGLAWFDGVRTDLEALDYACGMAVLPACSVGAPHRRDRIFWVAYCEREGPQGGGGEHELRSSSSTVEAGRNGTLNGVADCESTRLIHWQQQDGQGEHARQPGGGGPPPPGCRGTTGVGLADAGSRRNSNESRDRICARNESCTELAEGSHVCRLADSDSISSSNAITCEAGEAEQRGRDDAERADRRRAAELERARADSPWQDAVWVDCADGKRRRVPNPEQGVHPLAPRIPGTVEQISAYGNSIVPQVAAAFIRSFMEAREMTVVADDDEQMPLSFS